MDYIFLMTILNSRYDLKIHKESKSVKWNLVSAGQLFAYWVILHAFLSSADIFQKLLSSKNCGWKSGLLRILTLCLLGNFSCFFLSSANIFQKLLFWKILSGIPSECQAIWNQIRPDVLSGLIWVQTVCKGCQRTTLASKELKATEEADSA